MNHPDTANIVVFGNKGDTVFTFQKDRSLYKTINFDSSWSNIKHTDITNVMGIEITRYGNISISISPMDIFIKTSTDCGETFTDNHVWSEDNYTTNELTKINSRYMGISATFDWEYVSFISNDGLNFLSIPYYMGYFISFLNYNFIYSRHDSLFITNDTNKTYQYHINPGITDLGLCEENSKGKLYMLLKDTLFTSVDSGWTWQRQSLSLTGLLYLNIDDYDNIYLRTTNKIFCSYDDCRNWTDITEDLPLTTCLYPEIRFSDTKLFTRADDGDIYYRDIYVGVKEQAETSKALTLYPNPVSDFLYISGAENHTIQIYTIEGIKVLETVLQDRIDVSRLATGVYFVKAGNKVVKFIKL